MRIGYFKGFTCVGNRYNYIRNKTRHFHSASHRQQTLPGSDSNVVERTITFWFLSTRLRIDPTDQFCVHPKESFLKMCSNKELSGRPHPCKALVDGREASTTFELAQMCVIIVLYPMLTHCLPVCFYIYWFPLSLNSVSIILSKHVQRTMSGPPSFSTSAVPIMSR